MYTVHLGRCSNLLSSKLQTKISLSILEAKDIALSSGMRELVTGSELLFELCNQMMFKHIGVSNISKGWEENTGTQNLGSSK